MYSHVFNLILEFVSITSLFKKKKKKGYSNAQSVDKQRSILRS